MKLGDCSFVQLTVSCVHTWLYFGNRCSHMHRVDDKAIVNTASAQIAFRYPNKEYYRSDLCKER